MKIIDAIVAEKAREHNTTVKDILSRSTYRMHVAPRHEAIREIAERHPNIPVKRVAEAFGLHTSQVYVVLGRCKQKVRIDADYDSWVSNP